MFCKTYTNGRTCIGVGHCMTFFLLWKYWDVQHICILAPDLCLKKTRPIPRPRCVMPSKQKPLCSSLDAIAAVQDCCVNEEDAESKVPTWALLFSQRIHQNHMDWRCTPEGNYSELELMSHEKWEILGDFPGPRDPTQSAVSSEVAKRLGSQAAIYPVRGTILGYLAKTITVVGRTCHPATSFWLDDRMVHSILAVSASLCPPVSPICGIAAATIVGSDIIVTHNSTPPGY